MRRGRWALAFASLLSFLVPTRALASPQDLYGFGGRSPGLAMTGVAWSNDFAAVYLNPAGLGAARRKSLVLGFQGAAPKLTVDGAPTSGMPWARGVDIGFALPLPFGGPLRDVLVLGAGFYTPTNTVMQTQALYYDTPQWPVMSRAQVVALQFGLGVNLDRWVPGLRFGMSVSGSANTRGQLTVMLDAANQFLSRTETQLVTRFAPIVGVQYQHDKLSVGLVYRAELKAFINLDIAVTDLPIPLPLLTISALAQFDPHTFAGEATYDVTNRVRVIANATYRRWSTYPGPTGSTSSGSNRPPNPGFRDTVSPRVATEISFPSDRRTIALRFGYAFEPTPSKPARLVQLQASDGQPAYNSDGSPTIVSLRQLDSNRHVLTSGFGLVEELGDNLRLRLDAYVGLQVLQQRTHDIPAPGGTTPMKTSGLVPTFGATMGAEW